MTTRAGSRLSASPMLMVIAAEGVRLAREHLNNLREAPTPTASMTPRWPASSARGKSRETILTSCRPRNHARGPAPAELGSTPAWRQD